MKMNFEKLLEIDKKENPEKYLPENSSQENSENPAKKEFKEEIVQTV
jgi:hypothetical protein